MNFKKTLAAVAASAIAVSAMATAAFADDDAVYGGGTTAEPATEIGFAELQDATSADTWLNLFFGDKAALKEVGKDKAIIVYVSDVNENAYFKVSGTDASDNWKASAIDGKVTTLEAYDAEAGKITIPYSVWGAFANRVDIQGGQGCKFWGLALEDDADTIAEIEALMAADAGAADEGAADEGAADEGAADEGAADEGAADEDASAGDTAEEGASKGNSDTGVEGVAAIAGLAIVAAGAVIVAKKRG